MNNHEKINYLEFPAKDIPKTKAFLSKVFGWKMIDYGPEYVAFAEAGIDGGFYKSDKICTTSSGSVLIVLYSNKLTATLAKIEATGGTIIKPIYSFPGGRRFHFTDPNGNEFAVWSDAE